MTAPFTDTVTLYNFIGENGGKAVYYRTVLTNVHTVQYDRTAGGRNAEPHSEAFFYFSDRVSRAEGKGYTSPESFMKRPSLYTFTFQPGRDLFCTGRSSEAEPPEDCYLITAASRHASRLSRLSHRKVTGEK